jgi:predicted AAA+ superfamily ATPase
VRQTGKTYALKQFGESEFSVYRYINFEENIKAVNIFKDNINPEHILKELSFLLNKEINIITDLLIFDEIQACPKALTSLKYFAEKIPHLALCCAGSLLGLHSGETSFPVGKVDFLHMHPMCFAEFLLASGDQRSLVLLKECKQTNTLSAIAHEHLWEQFKYYLIIGGLPEVVQVFIEHKKDLFTALTNVREKQSAIIYGYYADIAKHAGKVNAMHIDRVLRAIPSQLAKSQDGSAKRFQFTGIIPGIDRYQRLVSVIDWLLAAELIIKVSLVEHIELPLSAFTKDSFFKLYLFDVGLLGALSDLTPQAILAYDYGTYKGYFAENFVAQEFVARGINHLYSWQHNRAEIEFLFTLDTKIIPIEVKSGWVTKTQSLNKYAEKYHPPYRAVFSAKPLSIDLSHHYHQYPIYMAYWFPVIDKK